MTDYCVRSRTRIYGPFYTSESAIKWVEAARPSLALSDGPLGVEMMDDPERLVPTKKAKQRDDNNIAF